MNNYQPAVLSITSTDVLVRAIAFAVVWLGGAARANQKAIGRIAKTSADGGKIETTIADCGGKLLAREAPPAGGPGGRGGNCGGETHAIMILSAGWGVNGKFGAAILPLLVPPGLVQFHHDRRYGPACGECDLPGHVVGVRGGLGIDNVAAGQVAGKAFNAGKIAEGLHRRKGTLPDIEQVYAVGNRYG